MIKYLFLLNFFWLGLFGQLNAYVSWNDSPNNWENSELNWKNSPLNWKNSEMNRNSSGIYDSYGNRTGYMVEKANGDVNLFSNNGQRIGYIKRKR